MGRRDVIRWLLAVGAVALGLIVLVASGGQPVELP